MNYNILQYIVTISEERNFTNAAKKLFIAQPSLSQIVKKEEERIGVKLFDRKSNPLKLTDAGVEYVLWAEQILSLFDGMENRLKDYSNKSANKLRIGILPECSSLILNNPLKEFRELNPKSFVQIKELSSSDLEIALENDEMDFIIGLTHSDDYKYISEPLHNEKIVLAYSSKTFKINEKEIKLSDFSNHPFVIMEKGQFLYNITYDLCKANGFIPKVAVECYNLETAMRLVESGVGLSIIPDLMTYIVEGLEFVNIIGDTPKSQISIVYKKDRYLIKEARHLIRLIKENANKYKK